MKEPLKEARKKVLCFMAGTACMTVRKSVYVLFLDDIRGYCKAIAELCRKHGCVEASKSCLLASQAKTETEFLEHCKKSCELCSKSMSKQNPFVG